MIPLNVLSGFSVEQGRWCFVVDIIQIREQKEEGMVRGRKRTMPAPLAARRFVACSMIALFACWEM